MTPHQKAETLLKGIPEPAYSTLVSDVTRALEDEYDEGFQAGKKYEYDEWNKVSDR